MSGARGIVGYVSNTPIEPGFLSGPVGLLRRRSDDRVDAVVQSFCAAAAVNSRQDKQAQIAQTPDGGETLIFFGRIYEPSPLCGPGAARALLQRWLTQGWRGLAGLNGEYAVVVWNVAQKKLTLVNDRLGIKRLYFKVGLNSFAFASELKCLAVMPQVNLSVNQLAMTELLTLGYVQESRTLFTSLEKLPAATVLIWHDGAVSKSVYWNPTYETDSTLTDDAVADALADRIEEAVKRRIHGHSTVGLMLSGGLDSRTLAGAVRTLKPEGGISSLVTGHGHDHDTLYANQLAQAIGSRHYALDIPKSFLAQKGESYIWQFDASVGASGCHRNYAVFPEENKPEVVLNGFLGDVLTGSNRLEEVSGYDSFERVIEHGFRKESLSESSSKWLGVLLDPEISRRNSGLVYERYRAMLDAVVVENPEDKISWARVLSQLLGESRAQAELSDSQLPTCVPFADNDVVDLMLRLPLKQRIGRKAYLRMICRKYPDLARIPRAGDGLPLMSSRLRKSIHWRRVLLKRRVNRVFGRSGHPYGNFVHCNEWFRSDCRSFIEQALLNNAELAGFFQTGELDRFVRSFFEAGRDDDSAELIGRLLSVAIYLKQIRAAAAKVVRQGASYAQATV